MNARVAGWVGWGRGGEGVGVGCDMPRASIGPANGCNGSGMPRASVGPANGYCNLLSS